MNPPAWSVLMTETKKKKKNWKVVTQQQSPSHPHTSISQPRHTTVAISTQGENGSSGEERSGWQSTDMLLTGSCPVVQSLSDKAAREMVLMCLVLCRDSWVFLSESSAEEANEHLLQRGTCVSGNSWQVVMYHIVFFGLNQQYCAQAGAK